MFPFSAENEKKIETRHIIITKLCHKSSKIENPGKPAENKMAPFFSHVAPPPSNWLAFPRGQKMADELEWEGEDYG